MTESNCETLSNGRVIFTKGEMFKIRCLNKTDDGELYKHVIRGNGAYCRQCGQDMKMGTLALTFYAKLSTASPLNPARRYFIHKDDCDASGFVFNIQPRVGGKITYRNYDSQIEVGTVQRYSVSMSKKLIIDII